jgi:hypothetical protein
VPGACQVRASCVRTLCTAASNFLARQGCAMWDALRLRAGRYARAKRGMCEDVRGPKRSAIGERAALQSCGGSAGVLRRDGQWCCQEVRARLSRGRSPGSSEAA